MLGNSLHSLIFYIEHLQGIDYVAFMVLFAIFFLFAIISFVLLFKNVGIGVLFIFILIVGLFVSPFVVKNLLNEHTRANELTMSYKKQLMFSDIFILQGSIKNRSKKSFSTCKIYTGFVKKSKSSFQKMLNNISPLYKRTTTLQKVLLPNESADFRIVYNNFRKNERLELVYKGECY